MKKEDDKEAKVEIAKAAERQEVIRLAIADAEKQTDRAAAIVLAAVVEDLLTKAIVQRRLVDDNRRLKKVMRGYGPLATFSAKIDIGFLLGLYPQELEKALHAVREIRNKFAHEISILSFESPEIVKLSKPFGYIERALGQGREKAHSPRNIFIGSCKFLLGALYVVATRKRTRVKVGTLKKGEEEG